MMKGLVHHAEMVSTYKLPNGAKVHTNLRVGSVDKKAIKEIVKVETLSGMTRCPPPSFPSPVPVDVHLNVYDLIDASTNKRLHSFGMGVFHSAIEVFGVEWSFGESDEGPETSGLFGMIPNESILKDSLHSRMLLGRTTLTPTQITWILRGLEKEWPSKRYHILHCNCNSFALEFGKRIQTIEPLCVPAWVNRVASWGDRIIPRRLATWAVNKFDEAAQENVPKADSGTAVTAPSKGTVCGSDAGPEPFFIFQSTGGGSTTISPPPCYPPLVAPPRPPCYNDAESSLSTDEINLTLVEAPTEFPPPNPLQNLGRPQAERLAGRRRSYSQSEENLTSASEVVNHGECHHPSSILTPSTKEFPSRRGSSSAPEKYSAAVEEGSEVPQGISAHVNEGEEGEKAL